MQEILKGISNNIMDDYDVQARLRPGLYTFLPIFISVWGWLPDQTLFEGVIAILLFCGSAFMFARFARYQGKKKEKRIFANNDGKFPTITMLRHRDDTIDSTTKERYYNFFQTKIKGFNIPSIEEETLDPDDADRKYESAVKWLIEQTRDKKKFPLVRKELINYGYERNLWGLKYCGIFISVAMLGLNIYMICIRFGLSFDADLPPLPLVSVTICIISLCFWLFFVKKSTIMSTAYAYARSLLSACENM